MIISGKKVIVFDLDGTLTLSKSMLTAPMADMLCRLLSKYFVVVVSGGAFSQLQKQVLSELRCSADLLKNLFLFPTTGSRGYIYGADSWRIAYEDSFSLDDREAIFTAFHECISELWLELPYSYGDLLEDRGSQVTFSGCGQNAPIDVKEKWDPDQAKRRQMVEILKKKIPQFEVRIGGITSIDVTKRGVNKAYAIEKIKNLLKVTDEEILFVGDALYKGGNDSSVKTTGVDFIQGSGPDEVLELLSQYV